MANARLNQSPREAYVSIGVNAQLDQAVREAYVNIPPGLVLIYGGNFQDCVANPLALGFVTVKLVSDSQENFISNGQVFAGVRQVFPLDMTGNVAGTQYLWANQALLPNDSYYLFNVFDQNGVQVWRYPLSGQIPNVTSYNLSSLLRS